MVNDSLIVATAVSAYKRIDRTGRAVCSTVLEVKMYHIACRSFRIYLLLEAVTNVGRTVLRIYDGSTLPARLGREARNVP